MAHIRAVLMLCPDMGFTLVIMNADRCPAICSYFNNTDFNGGIMLTYLINVTDDMLLVSLLLGVMLAFMDHFGNAVAKIITRIGLLAGFVIAAVRSYITNTRRLVDGWKVGTYGYVVALILFLALMVVLLILSKKFFSTSEETKAASVSKTFISVLTAGLIASYLYGTMPNVFAYPFKFDTGGNGVLSTDYLFRLGGYLLGIVICVVSAVAAYKLLSIAAKKGFEKLLSLSFFLLSIIFAVNLFAKLMLILTPRKIIDSPALFNFAAASSNNSRWYTYIAFIILIFIAVFLWVKSHTAKEPYTTNAQRRKHRVLWRDAKRYTVVTALCFVMGILCTTLFVKMNTVVIEEAPVEETAIVKDSAGNDKELRVGLETVSDGHLHRFGYTTAEGYPTRFIVVLKQENTGNYGVGLDACEICGEAGYYENKDSQVVCKKCGVVMNKTTIGMKGGCNPIIIDYDIVDGDIIVPVEEMVKNQSRFKK